jgi:hypothetical protein
MRIFKAMVAALLALIAGISRAIFSLAHHLGRAVRPLGHGRRESREHRSGRGLGIQGVAFP